MKKLFCVSLLSLAPFLAAAEISDSGSADAVACVGRIVPGARISKLAAPSLGGAQAIVETLNIRKGGYVEKGQIVAVLRGAAKAKAAFERAEKSLAAAKANSDMKTLQQENFIGRSTKTAGFSTKRIRRAASASRLNTNRSLSREK